jgi:putative peptidoglycan binding protein/CHAP domain-containing protein
MSGTVQGALAFMQANENLGEDPPGSNHNFITDWYGMVGPWCAMTVSRALVEAGFTADGDTMQIDGVTTTTAKGWAYVPFVRDDFADAGRFDDDPRPGDLVIFEFDGDSSPDHIGIVERVEADGSVWTYEGNHQDRLEHVLRSRQVIAGFCHPPYSDSDVHPADSGPLSVGTPPFPGYCSLGSVGTATRQTQQRLKDRGWTIDVDGEFGPGTDAAVRKYQANHDLEVDGVVGPQTWDNLWTSRVS